MPAYRKNNPISLVFVVPDDIYDSFEYQDIVTKDQTSRTFQNIQQWVLKVNISTNKSPMFTKTGEVEFSSSGSNSKPEESNSKSGLPSTSSSGETSGSKHEESDSKSGSSTFSSEQTSGSDHEEND